MPSYLITGTSRGIGWELLHQLSSDPSNIVFGLVRNKPTVEAQVSQEWPERSNVHILQGDITDYSSLQSAATEVAAITGGGLDYLIANAGAVAHFDAYDPIGVLGEQPEALERELMHLLRVNIVGNIHLFNVFVPLIRQGQGKKIIAITSGQAALDMIPKLSIELSALYAISKAGLNIAVAKFSAQYDKEGILFMSVCPGLVDTGRYNKASPEQAERVKSMMKSFAESAPDFKGPSTTEASVKDILSVMSKASVSNGDGGSFVSHFGNHQWL
ncbi:NAD(P)-binding protein [Penicillium malachiteum]|uniref:NAD(P)-binding protein n=1 Tax=Penicillium malachiteum TaxID=1324776 RepID=UPI002549209E|nr:NAD(P)-binding protein [Penicillium malachiteum]KAJ5715283.1 NAD(P)-binding protein [Penicillium malachiteum]